MYLLLTLAYRYVAWHIPSLIPLLSFLTASLSVINSNSILVFFKHAFHANPGALKKRAGSSSYLSMHLSLKFSNTSASNDVSD